jgi:hypothetical protein
MKPNKEVERVAHMIMHLCPGTWKWDTAPECVKDVHRTIARWHLRHLRGKLTCFKCGDGSTPLYCLNCAEKLQMRRVK